MAWIRRHMLPLGTIIFGAALIALSFRKIGQWSAVLLEVGAGFALAGALFHLERQMERRLGESQERLEKRQDQTLSEMETRLDGKIAAATQAAAVQALDTTETYLSVLESSFFENRTPANLVALADVAADMGLSRAWESDLATGWKLNTLAMHPNGRQDRNRVQLTLISKTGSKKPGQQPLRVNWTDEQSYEAMITTLLEVWRRSDKWPGKEAFLAIDFPQIMAEGYVRNWGPHVGVRYGW